jgi:hypothetical protein
MMPDHVTKNIPIIGKHSDKLALDLGPVNVRPNMLSSEDKLVYTVMVRTSTTVRASRSRGGEMGKGVADAIVTLRGVALAFNELMKQKNNS